MPYIRISYEAPRDVWVKISEQDAADRGWWDEICDAVNSNADVEHSYDGPVDELPDGMTEPDWDLTPPPPR